MKKTVIIVAMLSGFGCSSCKKQVDNTTATLALLQHKWMVTSLNGEALRYIGATGDYYNFSTNNFLYRFINKNYDTLSYSVQSNGKTLVVYPIVDGAKSAEPTNYNIKVLDSSELIIDYAAGTFHAIDSLKR